MALRVAGKIERVNGKELRYADFAERYLAKNQPVVLTGLIEEWRAYEDWVADDGRPNLGFLSAHFGVSRVAVDLSLNLLASQFLELIALYLAVLEEWYISIDAPISTSCASHFFVLEDGGGLRSPMSRMHRARLWNHRQFPFIPLFFAFSEDLVFYRRQHYSRSFFASSNTVSCFLTLLH